MLYYRTTGDIVLEFGRPETLLSRSAGSYGRRPDPVEGFMVYTDLEADSFAVEMPTRDVSYNCKALPKLCGQLPFFVV